jgi:putative transposase
MARRLRIAPGGLAYHVLNRRTGRARLFDNDGDYEAFLRVLAEARVRQAMRVCSFVLMPNHWHLVLWPRKNGDLPAFMRWLTMTHAQRWHACRRTTGAGHLYQSRYKSFPIEDDDHYLTVCRYVERNPLRANLVQRAQDWRWSSLSCRREAKRGEDLLDPGPVAWPILWLRHVNQPQTDAELAALRKSIRRGTPFGNDDWVAQISRRLDLESTLRPRGRPPKPRNGF